MDVNNINKVTSSASPYDKIDYKKVKDDSRPQVEASANGKDGYVPISNSNDTKVAKTYTRDSNTIDRLKMEVEKQTQQLRDIVEKLIMQQGEKTKEIGLIEIDADTALKAQEEISEDGFWGVKQTSQRMFDFAKALSGGDPAKAQMMKDAFIEGFERAKEAWGGELPEISNKTYDATIKMFDEWIGENQE